MRKLLCILSLLAVAVFVGLSHLPVGAHAADTQPAGEAKVVADFETDADLKLVKAADDQVTIAIDESHATAGKKSLKITSAKGNDYGPMDLLGDALKDMPKYKYLVIDFTTDQDVTVPVTPEVWDDKSTDYQTRATQDEGIKPLKKGKVTVVVDLSKFERNDKSGKMDMSKITKFRIIFTTKDLKDDLVTYMDNVRLTNTEPK